MTFGASGVRVTVVDINPALSRNKEDTIIPHNFGSLRSCRIYIISRIEGSELVKARSSGLQVGGFGVLSACSGWGLGGLRGGGGGGIEGLGLKTLDRKVLTYSPWFSS